MSPAVVHSSVKTGKNASIGEFAVIKNNVIIGDNVTIGNNVVIHEDTIIGDNVDIADNAVLGKTPQHAKSSTAKRSEPLKPLIIGAGCRVGVGAILYRGTEIGQDSVIADLASIRERCILGSDVVVGRGVAVENDTIIGSHTKIQTGAYITAYMNIEDNVFIAPMVQTTNDNYMGRTKERFQHIKGAHIKRGARIGGGATLLPAVTIEEESFIAAGALVTRNTEKAIMYLGIPARPIRRVNEEELLENQRED